MKVLTVVGARPQFIKAAPVSRALRSAGHQEILVHTGQHYDHNMSEIFFNEMGIPTPDYNLRVGSSSHARQTGEMLIQLEELMQLHRPEWVLVYGDTNSTLAGALAAVKLQLPIAHVEAGLRSFNRTMPEEHNRVLTDHCAEILFCPTQTAVNLLAREGLTKKVFFVGDTMYDAVLHFADVATQRSRILEILNINSGCYLLATVHRPYNTDIPENLSAIFSALADLDEIVIFPIHPRTRQRLPDNPTANVRLIDPVGYLDMLMLEQNARMILTDSGGIQKEAYFFKVPCLTLRPETEWIETLEGGWNIIVGADHARILQGVGESRPQSEPLQLFGDGHAAEKILHHLQQANYIVL
jgi:UDP-GlcNAc3NAcA epimerase